MLRSGPTILKGSGVKDSTIPVPVTSACDNLISRGEELSETHERRSAKVILWSGRVIGLIASIGWLLIMTASATHDITTDNSLELASSDVVQGALVAVIAAIALAGCIFSWWRLRASALLLVIASAGMGIHIAFNAGRNHFFAWSVSGLPFLIAGVLFLGSWWVSRRA